MYEYRLYLQTRENQGEIHRGLLHTATSAEFDHLAAAVAYASKAGCTLMAESFESNLQGWTQMRKEWLISVDHGFTDPDALVLLSDLPNSSVRVVNAECLVAANLAPETHFHNKLYLFECGGDQDAIAVFSGSANLTLGGLYLNNEQATASIWTPPLGTQDRLHLNGIRDLRDTLHRLFADGTPVNTDSVRQYRGIRRPGRRSESRTEILQRVTEPSPAVPQWKAIAMAVASSFWVEVNYVVPNLGNHRPGNQIDLQKGSRVFFGFGAGAVPRNTLLGTVRIRSGGQVVDCHMRYGNNHMDKLNLPLPGTHGPPTYEYQTLLFRRNAEDTFDLSIGSDQDVAEWKGRSSRQWTLFRLRSGREYGVFT